MALGVDVAPGLLSGYFRLRCRLDFHSREFKFGDFAIRINCLIGQDICRRLNIAKGQEHHILRHRTIGPCHHSNGATLGGLIPLARKADSL